MQLPVKAHYATVAMLSLASLHASRQQVPARCIAREHGIPGQFLGQILQQLRSAGLITSARGANGGFRLARDPDEICIAEIVDATCSSSCPAVSADDCSPLADAVYQIWSELDERQKKFLQKLSLADLLARVDRTPAAMFYI